MRARPGRSRASAERSAASNRLLRVNVLARPGRRGGHELVEQPDGRRGHGLDRGLEGRLVGPRGLPVAADLAHELERGGARLLLTGAGPDVVERVDASAHGEVT